MEQFLNPSAFLVLSAGLVIGYLVRQNIAKRRAGSLEERLGKMVEKARAEVKEKQEEAKQKAQEIISEAKNE
ncbi:MAG: hypothetical protein AAB911_00510, partial [Patescibacteria group bacterium]